MPAVVELAKTLGVTQSRAVRAFEELAEAGLIESHVGRGTFVKTGPKGGGPLRSSPGKPTYHRSPVEPIDLGFALAARRLRMGIARSPELSAFWRAAPGLIDLTSGIPDPSIASPNIRQGIVGSAFRSGQSAYQRHGWHQGMPELREQIAQRYAASGLSLSVEHVPITSGSQQAVSLLAQMALEQNIRIVCEVPCYTGVPNAFGAIGHWVETVPRDALGPSARAPPQTVEPDRIREGIELLADATRALLRGEPSDPGLSGLGSSCDPCCCRLPARGPCPDRGGRDFFRPQLLAISTQSQMAPRLRIGVVLRWSCPLAILTLAAGYLAPACSTQDSGISEELGSGGSSDQSLGTRATSGISGSAGRATGGDDDKGVGTFGDAGGGGRSGAMGKGGSAGASGGSGTGTAGAHAGGASGGAGRAGAAAAGAGIASTSVGDSGTGEGGPGDGSAKPETTSVFGTGADYPNCYRPSHHSAADMQAVWEIFLQKFVTSAGANGFRRVQRPEYSNDTVSEGIGYGMIAGAYAGDCKLVGDLWDYSQKYLNDHGLMHWHINADGSVAEQNGATDGDEDIAWGLLIASKKCTNKDFLSLAKSQIGKIWSYEISNGVVGPGDHWGQSENKTNPSYFAPAYYRVFAKVTGQNGWNDVASKSYQFIKNDMNNTTGLVSEWCKMSDGSALDSDYGYNAARMPLRIGEDLCLNGSSDAKSYLMTMGAFFNSIPGDQIKTEYKLDGTTSQNKYGNSTYTGPAAVSMMVATSFAQNLDLAYDTLIKYNLAKQDDGAELNYYNGTLGLLSMLVLNGAFLSY